MHATIARTRTSTVRHPYLDARLDLHQVGSGIALASSAQIDRVEAGLCMQPSLVLVLLRYGTLSSMQDSTCIKSGPG